MFRYWINKIGNWDGWHLLLIEEDRNGYEYEYELEMEHRNGTDR